MRIATLTVALLGSAVNGQYQTSKASDQESLDAKVRTLIKQEMLKFVEDFSKLLKSSGGAPGGDAPVSGTGEEAADGGAIVSEPTKTKNSKKSPNARTKTKSARKSTKTDAAKGGKGSGSNKGNKPRGTNETVGNGGAAKGSRNSVTVSITTTKKAKKTGSANASAKSQ